MDGDAVRRWCRLAADALTQTRAAIDALNVFPVPDADTGTNLQLTLLSAADAAEAVRPGPGPEKSGGPRPPARCSARAAIPA